MEAPFLLELLERSRRSSPAPLPEPLVSALGDVLLAWLTAEHAQTPPRLHRETFAKLQCMSPEQARGRPIDVRSDVFAAGVLLFELACGKRPFDGISELVAGEISTPLEANPQLSAPLAAVLSRALALEPSARFATAAELRAALEVAVPPAGLDAVDAWAAPWQPKAEPVAQPVAPAPPPRMRGVLRWLGATALVLVPIATTLVVLRFQEQRQLDLAEGYAASLRPCEIISDPPGAGLIIDGVPHTERAPTTVRFEPGREYVIELRGAGGVSVTKKVKDQKRMVVRLGDSLVSESEIYGIASQPRPKAKPEAEPEPIVEEEDAPEGPQRVVAYDFEQAPVDFTLEPEHQVFIPRQNCIEVPPLRTKRFRTYAVGVFAHITTRSGSERLVELDRWAPEASTMCVFMVTDAPTQLELNKFPLLRWEQELNGIKRPLVFVDGSDRVLVRSFPPGKWRVRVSGGKSGLHPVMVATLHAGTTLDHVLDRDFVVENPKTMWFTVPLRASAADLRFSVRIEKVK